MTENQYIPDVKERILQVSRELFIKNGYNGTSVRDIAAASGTNVAHIKYYFQSKYNLFEIIFDEAFDILVRRIFSILRSDMPFFELVEHWINAYYEMLTEYPQIPLFILNEIDHNPDGVFKRIKKRGLPNIISLIASRLDEEAKKGTIKETPAIDFGLNIISLCVFPFLFGKFVSEVSETSKKEYNKILEQHRSYVVQFVIKALKP
jgi:AcrR family transcriptional regulator